MKNKMTLERLTIYDIKSRTAETEPYFFSRQTMKFFGQRMSDFSVKRFPEIGKYLISAPSRDYTGRLMGYSERWFNPVTNELEFVKKEEEKK